LTPDRVSFKISQVGKRNPGQYREGVKAAKREKPIPPDGYRI